MSRALEIYEILQMFKYLARHLSPPSLSGGPGGWHENISRSKWIIEKIDCKCFNQKISRRKIDLLSAGAIGFISGEGEDIKNFDLIRILKQIET